MIIGVTGKAQHGKDSTGRLLVERYNFARYAFADALKSMALALDPIILPGDYKVVARLRTVVEADGWERAKQLPEVRRFLQVLGTEAVRNHLGEDAWVKALEKKLAEDWTWEFSPTGEARPRANIVVTDVRFPNEAEAIRDWGGVIWRVVRPDYDNGVGAGHPSEQFVEGLKVDAELRARTLDELATLVDEEIRRMPS